MLVWGEEQTENYTCLQECFVSGWASPRAHLWLSSSAGWKGGCEAERDGLRGARDGRTGLMQPQTEAGNCVQPQMQDGHVGTG